MGLPVLAALVVVGIALIVLAIHLTGGSRAATIADAEHARALLAADHPNAKALDVVVTADRRAAFLALHGGGVGLVHAIGLKYLTRIYAPGQVGTVRREGERTLVVRPGDFTFSGGRFAFADPAAADTVERLLHRRDDTDRRAA